MCRIFSNSCRVAGAKRGNGTTVLESRDFANMDELALLACVLVLLASAGVGQRSQGLAVIPEQLRAETEHTVDRLWDKAIDPGLSEWAIIRELKYLSRKVEEASEMSPNLGKIPDLGARASSWVKRWESVVREIEPVEEYFSRLRQAQEAGAGRLELPADAITKVPHIPDKIRQLTARGSEGGIYRHLDSILKGAGSHVCRIGGSPNQVLYQMYSALVMMDIKAFIIMQFLWLRAFVKHQGDYTIEVEMARADMLARAIERLTSTREVLETSSSWYWPCDPAKYVENASHLQVDNFLQAYLENEVSLADRGHCRHECSSYKVVASPKSCAESTPLCASQRPCKGRLFDCRSVESTADVCLSAKSDRRYEWIKFGSGLQFGEGESCPQESLIPAYSWHRWVFWRCSYCLCLCDEPGSASFRYFSLREAVADQDRNRVVTGAKITRLGRVFHLEVQEAEVTPRGTVNNSSLGWIPPCYFDPEQTDALEGKDYAALSWEQRAIDLDDLNAPPGYAVTGLRFRQVGGHLNLEVRVTPVDFNSGLIRPDASYWIGNDNTAASEYNPRMELKLADPDVPTRTPKPSEPDSKHDQYVNFAPTSLVKDASQSTVPFLDSQKVSPLLPTWVAGVGLFHKGQPGYGGFLALKVLHFDVARYL